MSATNCPNYSTDELVSEFEIPELTLPPAALDSEPLLQHKREEVSEKAADTDTDTNAADAHNHNHDHALEDTDTDGPSFFRAFAGLMIYGIVGGLLFNSIYADLAMFFPRQMQDPVVRNAVTILVRSAVGMSLVHHLRPLMGRNVH
jgi:hypothetical protein